MITMNSLTEKSTLPLVNIIGQLAYKTSSRDACVNKGWQIYEVDTDIKIYTNAKFNL